MPAAVAKISSSVLPSTKLEACTFLQPGPHLGRHIGCVVVENQMDVAGFLHRPLDAAEEGQELLCGHCQRKLS